MGCVLVLNVAKLFANRKKQAFLIGHVQVVPPSFGPFASDWFLVNTTLASVLNRAPSQIIDVIII